MELINLSDTKSDTVNSGEIRNTLLGEALSERYLAYAMSTIMSRSLPDVRDGLKPVHRRLLYAMNQLHLDPNKGFKKCARVVGDVIGKYHPHGDTAVYDAMVRLAQTFAVRYPLVEGQGNFGNIDGDGAAAMRYTEARLTPAAMLMLEGLNENAVDFRETYDGEDAEPIVLAARFPNILANGSSGIAVGMATNIPPHNILELCDALLYLIKSPNAAIDTLMKYIKGPDFPTGGVLVEDEPTILNAYKTGRGSLRIRAKWEEEKLSHGMYRIVITEIPYQVQKAKLIEKIADLIISRKIQAVNDVRDESDENIRIVIEPRSKNIEAALIMEQLFKLTDLESRFSFNVNVLNSQHIPKVMALDEILHAFLAHKKDVLIRQSQFKLDKIIARLEILEGLLIAYLNIDEVIKIIREEDKPKPVMVQRFNLTDNQAEAILNMRLRQLRKLEEFEIKKEHEELSSERDRLSAIIASDDLQWKEIATDIKEVKKIFAADKELSSRRTEVTEAAITSDINFDALVEKEPLTFICSKQGWIRAIKGHNANVDDIKYKEGDEGQFAIEVHTTDKLFIMSSTGRFFTLGCDKLPSGRGFGQPLSLILDLPEDGEIVKIIPYQAEQRLLVASTDGRGFITDADGTIAGTKTGKQVLNVAKGEKALICYPIAQDDDMIAVIGQNRRMLAFKLDELPEMGRGRGVILQRYRLGKLADVKTFNAEAGLTWQLGERTRTETDLTMWIGSRGNAGRMPPSGFPKNNQFS
ncbi:MAG: DNA topoisomerase IV subunit A [Alphaproteobacteria bacterium]